MVDDVITIRRRFEDGIKNGEWFEIIYSGGSKPGSRRAIAPIAVLSDRVRARCYSSNSVKPFLLSKIEIVSTGFDASQIPRWENIQAAPDDFPGVTDVRDVHRLFGSMLSSKGWRVELADLEFGWALRLFGSFKNGKPRKSPTLVISFEHTASDAIAALDETSGELILVRGNLRPRVRPWSFGGTYARSYKPVCDFLAAAGLSGEDIEGHGGSRN